MNNSKKVALWLFACCFMVSMMVLIGGLTRLTGSGLSMTDWRPVTGFLPPFSESQWNAEFSSYKETPEYQHINYNMDLEGFKGIFWLEFIHRVAGRITGFVFFIPFIFFLAKGYLSKKLCLTLLGVLLLGGSQALVGWLMVSSGLKDKPHVSQYWLAFHLAMAFIIFAALLWLALAKFFEQSKPVGASDPRLLNLSIWLCGLVFLQVVLGGFVAGTNAGLVYNSFPDMDGQLIPDGLFFQSPWYINFFENITTIQFTHRMVAYMLICASVGLSMVILRADIERKAKNTVKLYLFVLFTQLVLGVITLLRQVDIVSAILHQYNALVLFALSLTIVYMLGGSNRQSIRSL